MTYVEGFITPVPVANRDAYRDHAAKAAPLFREFGATRFVEAWGDDVPAGTRTDFVRAVQATAEEAVLFSWLEYPDKATRDDAGERMMRDPRMEAMGDMPFDGSRMVYSGFEVLLDEGDGGRDGGGDGGGRYVDGFVAPVLPARRDDYVDMARKASVVFRDHGALRVVESWGDDLMRGKKTDFHRAVETAGDENVVFSWIEWPDRATRDAGMKAVMEDPRMQAPPTDMPFDGKRLIYGGFAVMLDA